MIDEDQTALIGAPGPYTWRGTVFAVSVEDDYLFRDKTHYYIPVIRGESPVDKYAYLGKNYQLFIIIINSKEEINRYTMSSMKSQTGIFSI